jgi:signal transduction histidine kinase
LSTSIDNRETQLIREANRLLAGMGMLLSDTDDLELTLPKLAEFFVSELADWCIIHLLKENGSIEQAAFAPADKSGQQAINDWLEHHLLEDEICGLPAVMHSPQSILVTDMASEHWAAAAMIKSYIVVPLVAHPQNFGAITFVSAEAGRAFDQNDQALFENLARHISSYLDKAWLARESQQLKTKLEQRVSERTRELRNAISQLKQSEATIQTQFRISNKLNATLEVDNILDELAQEAIRIVNGESGFAGLRTPEGMSVRKYFHNGVAIPFEYTWAIDRGIPGWVLRYKVPYGTSDAANDPRMLHQLSINQDVRSVICTPILDSAGEVLGYFDIRNKKDAEGFTISDQEMLMALAPVASIAIQNALAYQQRLATVAELKETSKQLHDLAANLESVREEERTQIARELHDQLGQALTATKFDLAWLSDQLKQKDPILAQKSKAVTEQMDIMIKTVRRIATELRPGMLDDLGLAASIEWQARDFGKRTGIMCAVSVPSEDLPLTRTQSIALFRIFQEALTNVARHASAQHIKVKLTATPEFVTLQVHDDGRGIQTHEIAGLRSLGLLGMRERATRLGGTFNIRGAPGTGTMVTVSIPIGQSD